MTDYERLRESMRDEEERAQKLLSMPYDEYINLPQDEIAKLLPRPETTGYLRWARELLGTEPKVDLTARRYGERSNLKRNLGDFTDEVDEQLRLLCDVSPEAWAEMSEERRCVVIKARVESRQTQPASVERDPVSNDDNDYLPAERKALWKKWLKCDASTLRRWVRAGTLRVKDNAVQTMRVHKGDFERLGGKYPPASGISG